MKNIPDDPIISCIERTGFPPWIKPEEEKRGYEFRRILTGPFAGLYELAINEEVLEKKLTFDEVMAIISGFDTKDVVL